MPQQNKKWTLHEEAALQEGIARLGPLRRSGTGPSTRVAS